MIPENKVLLFIHGNIIAYCRTAEAASWEFIVPLSGAVMLVSGVPL